MPTSNIHYERIRILTKPFIKNGHEKQSRVSLLARLKDTVQIVTVYRQPYFDFPIPKHLVIL